MQNDYDFWMNWSDRLRKARDDARVSDADISAACKVKQPSVHAWMTGKTKNIEAQNLLAVCRYLNVSPFWVMMGDDMGAEVTALPQSMKIGAADVLKLIALFAQSTDEGKAFILESAIAAEKSIA